MLRLLQLKTLLKSLVLPPAGPVLLALLGLFLLKRRPRLARVFLAVGLASLWLLSMPVVSFAVTHWAEHYPALDLSAVNGAEAIVILGGGGQQAFAPEYGGPAAEPVLLQRLAYGAYVARKTGLPVLVTGYEVEAIAMRETLLRNFDVKVRWIDDRSYDTFQNAQNSVRMLKADGVHRIILITHATHLWRAVQEFESAGIDVVPAPAGILYKRLPGIWRYVPSADALLRSYTAINELLGEPARAIFAATNLRRH